MPVILRGDGDDWVYFNKGNANILYQYAGSNSAYKGKLLRLRLSTQEYTTKEVFEFIESSIKPVLKDVIPIELAELKFKKEGTLNEGYGLLLSNVLSQGVQVIRKDRYFTVYEDMECVVIEIKPKWLFKNEYGCRNCAHHRYKYKEEPTFCSRLLLDDKRRDHAIRLISEEDKGVQGALNEYLKSDMNVFKNIQKLQDPKLKLEDLTSISEVTPLVKFQMTLRDVTIFIKIQSNSVRSVAIVDVDPKSASKWEKWKATEQKLISGNFYNL